MRTGRKALCARENEAVVVLEALRDGAEDVAVARVGAAGGRIAGPTVGEGAGGGKLVGEGEVGDDFAFEGDEGVVSEEVAEVGVEDADVGEDTGDPSRFGGDIAIESGSPGVGEGDIDLGDRPTVAAEEGVESLGDDGVVVDAVARAEDGFAVAGEVVSHSDTGGEVVITLRDDTCGGEVGV